MITISIGADQRIRVTSAETGEPLDHADIADASRDTKVALYGRLRAVSHDLSALTGRLKLDLEDLHKEGEVESAGSYGGVKLWRSSSRRWDPARVVTVLQRLVEDGTVTAARARAAAPTVERVKPDGRKLNVLLQELAGTEAGAALAATKTDTVTWASAIVTVDDVEPVAEQDPAAVTGEAVLG